VENKGILKTGVFKRIKQIIKKILPDSKLVVENFLLWLLVLTNGMLNYTTTCKDLVKATRQVIQV
jgi:hypothetical protein